jgi:hypothetical protein
MGSQFFLAGAKIAPTKILDGAKPRKKVHVQSVDFLSPSAPS